MADDQYGQFNTGSNFYQQGQTNYGPQYNAEKMHVQYTHPRAVADGLAADRQRRKAQQDALRRRDRERYDTTQRKVMRVTWWIVGFTVALFFLFAIGRDFLSFLE
ncbi:hypothetical protein [Streptomyces sp. E5N91]|uniref:hypothetical protein n=1 Tax=Streptomyces sp. E5N91 TaxID=1851996 RepID=UPI000EF6035F|nr:hypothetical protein [Streptomyces sp. E5N91]